MSGDKYAVIDIGSLKVKYLVGGFNDTAFEIYHTDSTLTCLGKGIKLKEHEVREENLAQTLEAVKKYLEISKKKSVEKVKIVATESLRKARNIDQVLSRFQSELGSVPSIISQEEEARVLFSALLNNLDYSGDVLAVDMGGGSVQLTLGNQNEVKDTHLLPLGVYYLQQKFFVSNSTEDGGPTTEELEKMKSYIRDEVAKINLTSLPGGVPLIYGSTNVLDLFKFLKFPLRASGLGGNLKYRVSIDDMMDFLEGIKNLSYKEREEKYPFQYGYMWGIDCAFHSIKFLAEHFGTELIVPSNVNIAEGIILEMRR
jgi:hypothetical protein